MRKEIKAPLTPKGLKMLINRCKKLSNENIKIQRLLLENSIINRWKNVFLPSESELKAVNQETQNELKRLFGIE